MMNDKGEKDGALPEEGRRWDWDVVVNFAVGQASLKNIKGNVQVIILKQKRGLMQKNIDRELEYESTEEVN